MPAVRLQRTARRPSIGVRGSRSRSRSSDRPGSTRRGATGLALPPDQRLAAGLPLLAGAGAGVATLGIGWALLPPEAPPGTAARLFLLASIIGLATVAAGVVSLWRRATREAGRPGSG